MAFPIITADQRLAENRRSSGVILGPAGVGKTTLLKTTEAVSAVLAEAKGVMGQPVDDRLIWPASSVARIRRCATISPTARRTTTGSAISTAIRHCSASTR